ncbi:hypothetical protein [Vibrio hangzhouensis]|uniref:Uncharacterized protein n=1 Tax=Vibrio hangzhouensis TaxID=462991 RepID=A0A1H5S4E4_9VIBR|nr:hypothetical protein [Vibrio hangzhouensis]SEF44641.1 hypothetical protein SAMN04488244_101217 [Vibrio hangzhouensis]
MRGCIQTKSKTLLVFMGIIFSSLSLMTSYAVLASDDSSDRPAWAGSQGNDGKPGRGNNEPGIDKGDLYGDLLIIVRDENGEPVKYSWSWNYSFNPAQYEPEEDTNGCLQPIANENAVDDVTGVALLDLPNEFTVNEEQKLTLVPLDNECEIPEVLGWYTDTYPDFTAYVQEVDFGRLSVARSPVEVIDSSYEEAMATINSATWITTDPAGRIQVTLEDDIVKTIDSPLENLALYKELMMNGYLTNLSLDTNILSEGGLSHLGNEDLTVDDMNTAAALLAGAADKFGSISLDLVININTFLGINSEIDKEMTYFDFNEYSYSRLDMYTGTTAVLLVPNKEPVSSLSPQRVNLLLTSGSSFPVFEGDQEEGVKAIGFTKAADDALKVINYIHNWALPELPSDVDWEFVEQQ